MARTATPLCVTAKMPMRASPSRMVSATLLRRGIARPPNGGRALQPAGRGKEQRTSARGAKTCVAAPWRLGQLLVALDYSFARLLMRRQEAQHGIRRKLVAHDCGIADLAEPSEVDAAPIHFADLG